MKTEIKAVKISAIGNVHHIIFTTLSDKVNTYSIGNAKITNLKSEIIKGLIAYLKDCKIPCTATENPINIYPMLDILKAVSHV